MNLQDSGRKEHCFELGQARVRGLQWGSSCLRSVFTNWVTPPPSGSGSWSSP